MSRLFPLAIVEGALEVPVSRRLFGAVGLDAQGVHIIDKGGRVAFWRDSARYNLAARHNGPILGLADLDAEPCANALFIRHLRGPRHPDFVLRIAKRTLESWLLADPGIAEFLGIPPALLPRNPDAVVNAKQVLVNLARRSHSRDLRADLVPEEGSLGVVGKGYVPRMTEFIEDRWRPDRAARRSRSLARALAAIRNAAEL